jgi:tetratricopeptide (TPR) repeat protein
VQFEEREVSPGVHAQHAVAGGRDVWTYAFGALPARSMETSVLDETDTTVAFSTIASWNVLARELNSSIEQRLAAGPAAIAKTPTLETAHAVIAWVRAHVRVTPGHLVVLPASFPPATPAETIAHGSGDGLSVAALAVALLRQASLPADIVLVRFHAGGDGGTLPGTIEFERALVHVRIGSADVWIDPGERHTSVGQLVLGEHARRALVVNDATTGLVTTPASTAADNAVREVDTYEVAEEGGAKLDVAIHADGDLATIWRAFDASQTPDELRRDTADAVSHQFRGELVSMSSTRELDQPYERTMAVEHVALALGTDEHIEVGLFPGRVLDELPDELRRGTARRIHAFRFVMPFTHEIESRITVPEGFEIPAAQPEHVRTLGALRVVERQRLDGPTLVVTYSLETPLQLSAAEVEATRSAVAVLLHERAQVFMFASTAKRLQAQHRDREAIAEARRVVDLHPRDAVAHERLSLIEVELGVGSAARREARHATQLEPKRPRAWLALGWALERDSFGRTYGFDSDRAGARAAYETAHKLDPKDTGITQALADLLELDARGLRVTHGPDLATALALRREILQQNPTNDTELDVARDLFWSGKLADAETMLRAMQRGTDRDQLLVTVLALGPGGSVSAMREADDLATGDTREKLLVNAADSAFYLRAYQVARQLTAPFHGSHAELMAAWSQHATRFDSPFKPTADPRSVAVEVAFEAIDDKRPRVAFWDADAAKDFMARSRWTRIAGDTSLESVEDVARDMTMQVDGDVAGWRVDATIGNSHQILYLAGDRGVPKLVATSELPHAVGRYLLRLLASGKDAAGERVLDWFAADTSSKTLASVWGNDEPKDRARMLVAAAVLAAASDGARALPILASCSLATKEGQRACDTAALQILEHDQRWSEMLDRATAAEAADPDFMYARTAHVRALRRLGRLDDAVRVASSVPAWLATDNIFTLARMFLAEQRGKLDEARAIAEDVIGRANATSFELNEAAWNGLFVSANPRTIDAAVRRALKLAPNAWGIQNTLALAELEQGQLAVGFADALESMRMRHEANPVVADWLVMARYYDLLGLSDDAVAAYRQVTPQPHPDPGSASVADFVAKRIAALAVTR